MASIDVGDGSLAAWYHLGGPPSSHRMPNSCGVGRRGGVGAVWLSWPRRGDGGMFGGGGGGGGHAWNVGGEEGRRLEAWLQCFVF